MGGTGYAATGGLTQGGSLKGCAAGNGTLTLLKPGKKCKKGQTAVAWNQTGPAGTKGATAAPGASGAAGAAGAAGASGSNGTNGSTGFTSTLPSGEAEVGTWAADLNTEEIPYYVRSSNPLVQMAENIARSHHEHWDGSGYPASLRGEGIPLVGRICAVVDVYDALLSKRAYKEAWLMEDVMAEIERGSGTHFDPDLVSAFLKLAPHLTEELHASLAREASSALVQPATA